MESFHWRLSDIFKGLGSIPVSLTLNTAVDQSALSTDICPRTCTLPRALHHRLHRRFCWGSFSRQFQFIKTNAFLQPSPFDPKGIMAEGNSERITEQFQVAFLVRPFPSWDLSVPGIVTASVCDGKWVWLRRQQHECGIQARGYINSGMQWPS